MANTTNKFLPCKGDWVMKQYPIKASTAFTDGVALGIEISSNDVTGNLTLMGTTNTTGADFMGIAAETVATTDTDYATAGKMKNVWVPISDRSRAEFAVGTGTFTAADVFKTVSYHSDSASLAVDTKGLGARIVKYISATKGECEFSIPNTLTA